MSRFSLEGGSCPFDNYTLMLGSVLGRHQRVGILQISVFFFCYLYCASVRGFNCLLFFLVEQKHTQHLPPKESGES